jgi:hypothetical protein
MDNIDFTSIDWDNVPKIEHAGTTGTSSWQTLQFGGIRMRRIEYSKKYLADHWLPRAILCIAWTVNLKANCKWRDL